MEPFTDQPDNQNPTDSSLIPEELARQFEYFAGALRNFLGRRLFESQVALPAPPAAGESLVRCTQWLAQVSYILTLLRDPEETVPQYVTGQAGRLDQAISDHLGTPNLGPWARLIRRVRHLSASLQTQSILTAGGNWCDHGPTAYPRLRPLTLIRADSPEFQMQCDILLHQPNYEVRADKSLRRL